MDAAGFEPAEPRGAKSSSTSNIRGTVSSLPLIATANPTPASTLAFVII
jgi:hypothetical protein